MDFEEGQMPYILEVEFVGRREVRSSSHKRRSEPLGLEYLLRKCREKNERIIHIQEQITNVIKSLKTIQRTTDKRHRKDYVRSISSSMKHHHIVKKKGY